MLSQSNPLVSIIVPTKNSGQFLGACLASIKKQSYNNIELIVVDNNSKDITKEIAHKFTNYVYNQGPERSSQRNFGAQKSKGDYIVFIDSDMELETKVIEQCVNVVTASPGIKGIVIPEKSFGQGFWAQCKALEKSFYVGVEWIEAARFFEKQTFFEVGGWNENMISGEDWDLSQRVSNIAQTSRINVFVHHNEGKPTLQSIAFKKYYYAKKFSRYIRDNKVKSNSFKQTNILYRYGLYFKHPTKIIRNPILWLGLIFMKTTEFALGIIGIILK